MIELNPCFKVVAIRGGYVVYTVEFEDDGSGEGEGGHHLCTDIATVTTLLIKCLESADAQPSRDHRKIERKMNGRTD